MIALCERRQRWRRLTRLGMRKRGSGGHKRLQTAVRDGTEGEGLRAALGRLKAQHDWRLDVEGGVAVVREG